MSRSLALDIARSSLGPEELPDIQLTNGSAASEAKSSRKRVKRACDKCSRGKTRCDGDLPCRHCRDYDVLCTYSRERKRPGRAPKATSAQQHLTAPDVATRAIRASHLRRLSNSRDLRRSNSNDQSSTQDHRQMALSPSQTESTDQDGESPTTSPSHRSLFEGGSTGTTLLTEPFHTNASNSSNHEDDLDPSNYATTANLGDDLDSSHANNGDVASFGHNILNHQAQASGSQRSPPNIDAAFLHATSFSGQISPLGSRMTLLPNNGDGQIRGPGSVANCRYSVILPVLPYLGDIISVSLACDLLDHYFTEPSTSLFECASPYVLTQIFRKKSFLHITEPRKCKPSLLAAMLWVAAQTSNASLFTTNRHARSRICSFLHEVCIGLLIPRDEEKSTSESKTTHHNKKAVAHVSTVNIRCNCISDSILSRGKTVDDVLTYVLLGTVISGGETRRECLQWWTKAWSLGKDLNLNLEHECMCPGADLQPVPSATYQQPTTTSDGPTPLEIEEINEERRRVWWLLYIADRHLALSYNAPLHILDAECQVYQPLDEATWQTLDSISEYERLPRFFGPVTKMIGFGLFEYFLPLMAILGDIVDIHHRFWHPRFGSSGLDSAVAQIERCLEAYQISIHALENTLIDIPNGVQSFDYSSAQGPFSAQDAFRPWATKHSRQKAIIAYCKHLLHVLYILLHGSWDPISMLDDPVHWITPQSFVKCAKHAIAAASSVSDILIQDPELSFMPYLFGIYLMHGSFILLVFADQIEMTTSETVIQACETIIRAHEVCVVTLNTEYQRNFRKVVRSALCTLRYSVPVDIEQHKTRRREFLSLYRWTSWGKGLAV